MVRYSNNCLNEALHIICVNIVPISSTLLYYFYMEIPALATEESQTLRKLIAVLKNVGRGIKKEKDAEDQDVARIQDVAPLTLIIVCVGRKRVLHVETPYNVK